jgi:hypothetical protein
MWEALFAFHICKACCCPPELIRRAITQRTVRAFAVILLPPACQCNPYIVQRAEPVGVQALVAQPPVEALDVPVLHRPSRLDMLLSQTRNQTIPVPDFTQVISVSPVDLITVKPTNMSAVLCPQIIAPAISKAFTTPCP